MRKIAKLLSMLLVVATLAALCTFSASAAEFKDISAKDEALYEAVQLLNSLGIAKGQSETTYGANKPVTREQMSAFIYRLMKEGRSSEGGANTTTFTDLKDPTFFNMISWAHSSGIIKGISETEFKPTGKITLQDCYVMITRALGYEKDGALNYPYDYIDIAEQIGLNENIGEDVLYTDFLNRGQVALILHNAFYADMNETYKESFIPAFEREDTKQKGSVMVEKTETISHKIYGIEIIKRRVVATPNKAIDLSALPNPSQNPEYKAYAPTGSETMDKDYIITAAIVPGEKIARLANEEAMIEFSELGLSGKADDYFLSDLTIFMKKDGSIMAASATGEYVPEAKLSVVTSDGENLKRDYYHSSEKGKTTNAQITADGKIRTGAIKFGTEYGYFYNIPENVDNGAWSLYPTADEEGRMTYKAGYTWADKKQPEFEVPTSSFTADPESYMGTMRNNHQNLSNIYANAGMGSYYNVEYYDSNNDSVVDYFWMQPYTFGWVVDKSADAYKTTVKHTGESANRAVFNNTNKRPEIFVGDAVVSGGAYTTEKPVFAYVSGPANIVKIATDEQNASIRYVASTSPTRLDGSDYNTSYWDAGFTINAYNSQNIVVGHIKWTKGQSLPTGIVALSSDLKPNPIKNYNDNEFHGGWRGMLAIGQKWEIYTANNRILWAQLLEDTVDLTKQYAIVDYINVERQMIVFNAGGIDFDASLEYDPHVYAYIGGKRVIVPIAKKVDGVSQDNEYFIDNGIVNEICSYEVNSDGKYVFRPYDFSAAEANAEDLAGEDTDVTYSVKTGGISLSKFNDNIYQFVPSANYTQIADELKPNGMKFVSVDENTLIIVKYVNEDDEDDFMVYSGDTMPNFDSEDVSMEFSDAYVVLKNNTSTTLTEKLSFLYCVIGGEIVDDVKTTANYAMIVGNKSKVDADGKAQTVYATVDPVTGTDLGDRITSKDTSGTLANFTIYELTEFGDIKNTTSGKVGSVALGSSDLTTVESFEEENNLIFLGNGKYVLVDEKTAYTVVDRYEGTVTVVDSDVLDLTAEDDVDGEYFNEGAEKLTVFVMTEEIKGEDIELATLVIIAKG